MTRAVILLAMAGVLAGCGGVRERLGVERGIDVFDGQRFRMSASADRRDPQNFVASARPVSASLDGALQAAEYEATRHCIKYFGTSEIDWVNGPDIPPEQLVDGDTLSLSGACRDF